MKINKKILHAIVYTYVLLCCLTGCKNAEIEQDVVLRNGKIELGFSTKTGSFKTFKNINNSFSFLEANPSKKSLWKINFLKPSGIGSIEMTNASNFQYLKEDNNTLTLVWSNFNVLENKDFKVVAKIKLKEDKPLSDWNIAVEGIDDEKISSVVFPIISGIKDLGNENLAVPYWLGEKMKDPRRHLSKIEGKEKKYQWQYPGRMSLQCIALYNDSEKFGLYTACNDSLAYRKDFSYEIDSLNYLTYKISNYPAINLKSHTYSPKYNAVIGTFEGDWISAAQQYRAWGTKQKWAYESRLKKGVTPKSLEQTALWEWNRGKSNNVLKPAKDLKQKLKLPVNVFWHWWHGCSYDDGFPEYFPPREGKSSFINAVKSSQEDNIKSIVYMNQMQWGTDTESWKKENASVYAVKDINGNLNTHTYNVFTGKSLTTMCMATQFWKDKYTALSNEAVNTYHTNGVYMDQACFSFLCYDKNHNHPQGGGNYWLKNFAKLTEQIRSTFPKNKDVFLAGEGVSEAWLPYLDAFLTLQVSMERYAGDNGWEPIPFFQAVYHQYAISYGNYSSLIVPPYDELWPKKYAPKEPLALLDEKYSKQFLMEQARSFVWGLQPTISNYQSFLSSKRKKEIDYLLNLARVRNNGLEYLLYGKFLRSPKINIPKETIDMSRLSIYAGKTGNTVTAFQKKADLLYSGTWKSNDNKLGIALASISDSPLPVNMNFNSKDYGMALSGGVSIIDTQGKKSITTYSNGEIQINLTLKPRQVCIIEIKNNIENEK